MMKGWLDEATLLTVKITINSQQSIAKNFAQAARYLAVAKDAAFSVST